MKKKNYFRHKKRFWINDQIRSHTVRLIDEKGKMSGDISRDKAIDQAKAAGLDLVLVGPSQNPPIAKILEYGKFLYEQERKERKNKASQKETELKEIRLSFNMSDHDREIKALKAKEFIEKGNMIKVHLRLRGRENIFTQKAVETMKGFADKLEMEYDRPPQKFGQVLSGILKKKKNESQNPQSNIQEV